MDGKNVSLTGAEWNVMETLWEHSPKTGREVADRLAETVGWSRTTALTMLGRIEHTARWWSAPTRRAGRRRISSTGSTGAAYSS